MKYMSDEVKLKFKTCLKASIDTGGHLVGSRRRAIALCGSEPELLVGSFDDSVDHRVKERHHGVSVQCNAVIAAILDLLARHLCCHYSNSHTLWHYLPPTLSHTQPIQLHPPCNRTLRRVLA